MDNMTHKDPTGVARAVLHFSGWPDAGKIIEHTLAELQSRMRCEPAGSMDMEGFWLTEAVRPDVHVRHGHIQRLNWPSYIFLLAHPPLGEPFLLGTGPEPSTRWRSFADQVLGRLAQWGCRELFLLGSLHDEIFHDEVLITSVAADARGLNRALELGCQPIEYSGPAAIHSAIMEMAPERSIHCLSIWVHLAFYLDAPSELLMAHLLRTLGGLLGLEWNTEALLARWQEREESINELIQKDDGMRQMLERIDPKGPFEHSGDLSSKVLRLDEFLKKRHEGQSDEK